MPHSAPHSPVSAHRQFGDSAATSEQFAAADATGATVRRPSRLLESPSGIAVDSVISSDRANAAGSAYFRRASDAPSEQSIPSMEPSPPPSLPTAAASAAPAPLPSKEDEVHHEDKGKSSRSNSGKKASQE